MQAASDRFASDVVRMEISRRLHSATLALACLFAMFITVVGFMLPAAAPCQVSTGDILGNINDPTGASLPGATIILRNTQTQERHTVTSDQAGEYVFTLLQPGQYSIE